MLKWKIACIVLNYKDSKTTADYINFAKKIAVYDYIIVVDNCSPDDSYERLLKFQEKNVIVCKTSHNGGYGAGNNYGIKLAKKLGCAIAFVSNPDVAYTKACIQHMIEFLKQNDDYAAVAPVQYNGYSKQRLDNTAWSLPTYNGYVIGSLYILRHFLPSKRYNLSYNQQVDCVTGAFLAVKIDEFLAAGAYDEKIFLYCEESTLGYRLKKKGYKTYLLVDEKYDHYESTSIKKSVPSIVNRVQMIYKSRLIYLQDYLKVNKFQLIFAKLCFSVSVFEERLKIPIRVLMSKVKGKEEL
ncbi:glycosyltransferase [Mitsuokella sp. WILCCON 0060]|uniref:glycosyltransferase n=1 Tax=Mitsuokella sp. WILCCON 0060 TaxID=3345341 RepID=UPI003F1D6C88